MSLRYFVLLFIFSLTLLIGSTNKQINFTKEEKEFLKNKKELKVCIQTDFYPIETYENNIHSGIVGEVFKIFEKNLPIPLHLVSSDCKNELAVNIRENRCDIKSVVIKGHTPIKSMLSTKSYLKNSFVLITKLDKPYVECIIDYKGKNFVVTRNSFKKYLKKKFPYLKIDVVLEKNKAINDVKSGKYFALIDLAMCSNYVVQSEGFKYLKVNGEIAGGVDCSIGVFKGNEPLVGIFNKLIDNLPTEKIEQLKTNTRIIEYKEVVDYELLLLVVSIFLIVITIITFFMFKQRKLNLEVKEQKENFEKLYQKSTVGVSLHEPKRLIDCNEAIVKMLGYSSINDLVETSPFLLSPKTQPDGQSSYKKIKYYIDKAILGEPQRFEWLARKADGKTFWVEIVLTNIRLSKKNIIHAMWIDIDEKIKLKKEEDKKNKLVQIQAKSATIGRLVSLISHQYRQPLTGINAIVTSVYHKLNKKEKNILQIQKELLYIEDITESLSNSISALNRFYSQEDSKKGFYIKDIINKSLNILFPPFASSTKPQIKINELNKIKLKGYATGLQQVFITILQNSIDSFEERKIIEPKITINLYETNEENLIEIIDNAGGVIEDNINKIFNPSYSTKSDNTTRGFGLSIAKDIIENSLNGEITVTNMEDGIKFTIRYKYV